MPNRDEEIARHIRRIVVKRPPDLIIEQLSWLISSGVMKPGEKLPPERVLAERFEVGRHIVREALHKLEMHGIVRTLPQSGTVVENVSVRTLEALIRNVLSMDQMTPQMLMEVRTVLELLAVELAARAATPEQIAEIRQAIDDHRAQAEEGGDTLEVDFLFHLKIAEASRNLLLQSVLNLVGPHILQFSHEHVTYRDGRPIEAAREHAEILEAVERHSVEDAIAAMRRHLAYSWRQYELDGTNFLAATQIFYSIDDDGTTCRDREPSDETVGA